jgi:hypothetical protein
VPARLFPSPRCTAHWPTGSEDDQETSE